MGRKAKYPFETKIDVVQRCFAGKTTMAHEATLLGIHRKVIADWIALYQSMGENGLVTASKNTVYTATLKQNAVEDYLNGKGSLRDICKKYKIRSDSQLRRWIKKYNGHEELKASGTGGKPIMTKGRKTTYQERIAIVQYCIENQNNYSVTAQKFQVSYQQVYTWMKKYEVSGIDALLDRRGRTKPIKEMSELERLRMENRLLKAENKRQEMEMHFLKKLEEIERRWD